MDASSRCQDETEDVLEEFPRLEDEFTAQLPEDSSIAYDHQKPMLEEEVKVAQRIHRDSIASAQRESSATTVSFVECGSSDATSITIRSRSDSSGTFSSIGSAHVDWEELDKSEEQAPRDEGSDEVRQNDLARFAAAR